MANLQQALQAVTLDLARLAAKDDFRSLLAGVFGGDGDPSAVDAIQSQLLRQDWSRLARVRVIDGSQLGVANAAFASANHTIYLSDRFLAKASVPELRAVLLEEIGHAIDARVNAQDRAGDEGELFSLLVRGLTPSASERQRILAEDDRRTLTIDGMPMVVEQSAPVVYETTTVFDNGKRSNAWIDYTISGNMAVWSTEKGVRSSLLCFDGTSTKTIDTHTYQSFGYSSVEVSEGSVFYTKRVGRELDLYRYKAGMSSKISSYEYLQNLQADGSNLAWQSPDSVSDTDEIYRYDGSTVRRVTNNAVEEKDVQLSGKWLAWAAYDGGDYEIYLDNGVGTAALTNNNLEDYSPVISGNRVAWLQANMEQENLFFYDGVTTQQVTSNQEIVNPLITGKNLVFQRREESGKFSLQFYNSTSKTITQLSADFGPLGYDSYDSPRAVAVSGNTVAWLENKEDFTTATLKLFNGSQTITVATNALRDKLISNYDYTDTAKFKSSILSLQGGKLIYLALPDGRGGSGSYSPGGELFVYDTANPSAGSTRLTEGENINYLNEVSLSGNQILWNKGYDLKLTRPSTKPILTITGPNAPVVEGFASPQTAILTVRLSEASTVPVTVNYETYNNWGEGWAGSNIGGDYTSTSGVLTFAAGVQSQTISVPILDDGQSEADEKFQVRLSAPSNAVFAPGASSADITISDLWQVQGANGATFTMPAGEENLTLTGSTNTNAIGNAKANLIRGNSGNNRLDGGGPATPWKDELFGGLGNDTYIIKQTVSLHDYVSVTENLNEGTDTVEFYGDPVFPDEFTLPENVENLILKSQGRHTLHGNNLNNVISGNSDNNLISGGDGVDTVSYADANGAVTVNLNTGSATGWGTDQLQTLENIIGSRFNDALTGDANSNVLTGGMGGDRLTGLGGSDRFDYRNLTHSRLGSSMDKIMDFNANSGGDAFLVASARQGFVAGGAVSSFTASAIATQLNSATFLPNYAATLSLVNGASTRWFVAINDAIAGFDATKDALVEVSGFTGSIGAAQFVVS